jgi:hypothetical protein
MMEQMTLNDLKTGMHVVTRDGIEYMVLKDTTYNKDILVAVHEDEYSGCWRELDDYNNNMTNKDHHDDDIIKVYAPIYEYTTLEYKFDCLHEELANMFFAEETMTKAEAEAKFGIRIVD